MSKEVPNMRLGKEQSAGYVEDTEVDPIPAEEVIIDSVERALVTPTSSPTIPVG
jgi:hypothetical protein